MEQLLIDPEAKTRIPLVKIPKDSVGNPYFIGKQQYPGTWDFDRGVSFMVFVAESGVEELQIAPADPSRRKSLNDGGATLNNGKLTVDLHPMRDSNGCKYYVGEVTSLVKIDMFVGVFFTVFTSIVGQEQIQISKLKYRPRSRDDK